MILWFISGLVAAVVTFSLVNWWYEKAWTWWDVISVLLLGLLGGHAVLVASLFTVLLMLLVWVSEKKFWRKKLRG